MVNLMSFLELEEVVKVFPGKGDINFSALRGITLNLEGGFFYSLIGPSGSGKTTLMNLIAGRERPTAGRIELEEIGIISSLKGKKLRDYIINHVGLVRQNFQDNLLKEWTILENIRFPMVLANQIPHEKQIQMAQMLCEELDIHRLVNRKPTAISGGEAQRASIAVALANNPKLLIADEPTGNLDSINTMKIVKIFKDICVNFDSTILVVTHNDMIANHADIAWRIIDGKIVDIFHKDENITISNTLDHQYTFVDEKGFVKIPDDMLKEANIKDSVKIHFNKKTGTIELKKGRN
jgi:putative ABC transport system ATP-binding protein